MHHWLSSVAQAFSAFAKPWLAASHDRHFDVEKDLDHVMLRRPSTSGLHQDAKDKELLEEVQRNFASVFQVKTKQLSAARRRAQVNGAGGELAGDVDYAKHTKTLEAAHNLALLHDERRGAVERERQPDRTGLAAPIVSQYMDVSLAPHTVPSIDRQAYVKKEALKIFSHAFDLGLQPERSSTRAR